jgi:hypothetical protein
METRYVNRHLVILSLLELPYQEALVDTCIGEGLLDRL